MFFKKVFPTSNTSAKTSSFLREQLNHSVKLKANRFLVLVSYLISLINMVLIAIVLVYFLYELIAHKCVFMQLCLL